MTVQMFDTVTVETVPDNPEAVAGYVGGRWPTFVPLVQRFPKALHLSIAVQSFENAECLDVEPGDATPGQAADWIKRQMGLGVSRPVIYQSVSAVAGQLAALEAAGVAREQVRIWTAHYTGQPHLCDPSCGFGMPTTADATQWTDRALGRNLDESLCSDTFFGPPPPDLHYERYPVGPFARRRLNGRIEHVSERGVVEEYDRLREHPHLHHVRLDTLRRYELLFLRKRVWWVAHNDPATGKPRPAPDWGDWRGWRWQKLNDRVRGETVKG